MFEFAPLAIVEAQAVERLLDRAFEPGRRTRTGYAIRAGVAAVPALSFAALDGAVLVGTIQCWPVCLVAANGGGHALVMVGPVAVEPARQGEGVGQALMTRSLAAAEARGLGGALCLIGDPDYYGRFGFTAARTAEWQVPGPVERHRLLARGDSVPAIAGVLGPRVAA